MFRFDSQLPARGAMMEINASIAVSVFKSLFLRDLAYTSHKDVLKHTYRCIGSNASASIV